MSTITQTYDRFGGVLEDNLVMKGAINPETNRAWILPEPCHGIYGPRIVYTDLPRGWDNEDDDAWLMRSWRIAEADKHLVPTENLVAISPDTIPRNDELMARIANLWKLRRSELDTIVDNVWAKNTYLRDNIRILNFALDDLDEAHMLFSRLHSTPLCEGMQQGFNAEFWIRNFKVVPPKIMKLIQDRIISLAEYVGAIKTQNPEQGFEPYFLRLDTIMDAIHNRLKNMEVGKIGFPMYQGGLIGLKTNAGIIDDRMVMALYQALKIHERFKNNKNAAICDLGAGNGLIVFWLYQMGYTNLYTVDLPHISLMQVHMLVHHFNKDMVQVTGETHDAAVKIMSMQEFFEHDYDLVVNSDSMPEMDVEWAKKYIAHIDKHAKCFYSINQETMANGQMRVQDLVLNYTSNMVCAGRHRFWMRPGYVEEWFIQK